MSDITGGPVGGFIPSNPTGAPSTPTFPTPRPGQYHSNPALNAVIAGVNYRRETETRDAQLRRRLAEEAMKRALEDIGQSETVRLRNTELGMENRGLLRSGETTRRLADVSAGAVQERARTRQSGLDAVATIDSNIAKILAGLAAEETSARAAGSGGGGGGGGGGGSRGRGGGGGSAPTGGGRPPSYPAPTYPLPPSPTTTRPPTATIAKPKSGGRAGF